MRMETQITKVLARETIDARSRYRVSPHGQPAWWRARSTSKYRWRARRNLVDPCWRGQELAGGVHPKPEKKTGFFAGHDPTRVSRVTWCSKCHGLGRVGSGSVQTLTGRVGSGQEVSKSRGSGQVGSRVFQISRVGSGRVKR